MRRFNGTSQGFQAAHLVGPTSGISFFKERRYCVGVSALFHARPRAGKKSVRFSCVLGEKMMLLRAKTTQNKTRVRRKSLRKPVACVYYTSKPPPRGRARWTENHPPERKARHERETPPTNKTANIHSPSFSSSLSSLSSASSSLASPPSPVKAPYAAWLSGWTGLRLFVAFC